MQVLWSVLLTRLFSGLAMVFPIPLNTVKTDDRCDNGGMFGNTHFTKSITSPNLP